MLRNQCLNSSAFPLTGIEPSLFHFMPDKSGSNDASVCACSTGDRPNCCDALDSAPVRFSDGSKSRTIIGRFLLSMAARETPCNGSSSISPALYPSPFPACHAACMPAVRPLLSAFISAASYSGLTCPFTKCEACASPASITAYRTGTTRPVSAITTESVRPISESGTSRP